MRYGYVQRNLQPDNLQRGNLQRGIADALDRMYRFVDTRRWDVKQIALSDLLGWHYAGPSGDLEHATGAFFAIRGLDVSARSGRVRHWSQPIIDQPEVGILGFLLRRSSAGVELLVQAKMEPGNVNGAQFGPTVQATRSNFKRVHGGAETRYLEYFTSTARGQVLFDAWQSEQGSRFLAKRNRNVVVEVTADVTPAEGYQWVPLADLLYMLRLPNVVNMDARSIMACLPPSDLLRAAPTSEWSVPAAGVESFRSAVAESCARVSDEHQQEVVSWVNAARTERRIANRLIGLRGIPGWANDGVELFHLARRHFSVIGVSVTTSAREVAAWDQPMIRSAGQGLVVLATRRRQGLLEVLVQMMSEAGTRDFGELGPTIQCITGNYRDVADGEQPPPLLRTVLSGYHQRVWFDNALSEEGGRFYHKVNRYVIVEFLDHEVAESPRHRWIAVGALAAVLHRSGYVNVELRSLLACLFAI